MSAATMRVAAVDEFEAWLGSRMVAGLSTGGVAHLRPAQITQAIADRRAPAKTVLSLRT